MRRLALSILVVAALLAPGLFGPSFVATASGSVQPTPVCPFCGTSFERAAEEQGVNASVAYSTVEIRVAENGTATWVVRNRLARGADDFRADSDRLGAAARRLAEDAYHAPEDPTLASARMENGTAVLTYRDPDGATRRAGLLVVEYFHDDGFDRWHVLNAERVTLSGPAGTVVTNTPESGNSGTAAGPGGGADRVTWRGNSTARFYEAPRLSGSPYVVFGPDRSAFTKARTTAALSLATLPIVVRTFRGYALYQTALYAVCLAVVVGVLRARPPGGDPRRWGEGVALAGVLGAVFLLLVRQFDLLLGPPVFGAGLGALALHPRTREALDTPRRQSLAAGGVLITTFLALAGIHAAVASSWRSGAATALSGTAFVVPLAGLLPLGSVLTADSRGLLPWGALAVGAFVAMPAGLVNFADPPSGFGAGLMALFAFLLAIVVPPVGAVVVAFGRSLASR